MASEGILFAYGNPLLDIMANDVTPEFLKKYELEANNAILADDKHKALYQDMVDTFKEVEYIPGGATQNSIRIAQWLIGEPKQATTFTGRIGKGDKFGEILEQKAKDSGVNVIYQYSDEHPTGTCAVLVSDQGKNRSLVAYLAAADHFTKDHLDKPENWAYVEKAKYYYISGFPLTVSPASIKAVGEHAAKNDKTFCFNLSAPFLTQFFKDPMMEVMPYVDILFGNESEAATFAKEQNMGTEDLKEIALKISELPKENSKRSRITVITQGADPTLVAKDGKVTEYPVIPIKAEDIVDTNGAGDAFVGGFLAQLVKGEDIANCIRCANYAANVIIQRSGATFPEKPDFK